MKYLFLDFETQSDADLRKVGTINYVNHPTTKVICAAMCDGDSPIYCDWVDIELPKSPFTLIAHNAFFELAVIKRFFPQAYANVTHVIDTLALCSINNIRLSLAQASVDLNLPVRKHTEGQMVMRKINRGLTIDKLTEQQISDLEIYCKLDVELCKEVFYKLKSTFTKKEQEVWALTYKYNSEGVLVDSALIDACYQIALKESLKIPAKLSELTNGELTNINQTKLIANYLKMDSIAKPFLLERLKHERNAAIRGIIDLRLDGGKKSVAKFSKAVDLRYQDKLFDTMLYHGSSTGRYTSKGVQLHNLIKAKKSDSDSAIKGILAGEHLGNNPLDVLSRAVRGIFIPPPNNDLIKADYSQIEARILAWLANDKTLLDKFENGAKLYEEMAAKIFNLDIDDIGSHSSERDLGKATVLGCGYGMGPKRFSLTTGSDRELGRRCVFTWRRSNPRIVTLWSQLQKALVSVVEKGHPLSYGPLKLTRDSWRLFIWLPSGRPLVYPHPAIHEGRIYHHTRKYLIGSDGKKAVTIRGVKYHILSGFWGGTFVENICQAISRDLLVEAMIALDKNPIFKFMFTVHDELIYSAPQMCYEIDDFESVIINSAPVWAKNIPLKVESEVHDRYFK